MWLGVQREGEGDVPSPYDIGYVGPFEAYQTPHVLWRGYILEGGLCILIVVDSSLWWFWASIQSQSWFLVSSHGGGNLHYHRFV